MALFINRDTFAAGRSVSSSEAQVSTRANWITPAFGFRPPPSTGAVSVTDSVNVVTDALLTKPGPVVSEAINLRLVPVAQMAFDRWPVSTGLSKSQLFLEIAVAGDGLSITSVLRNTAPYAAGIHDGAVAQDLIFTPGLEAAREMARDIAKGLAS